MTRQRPSTARSRPPTPTTPNLDGATIAITGGLTISEDELTFTDASPITGAYNATTGVLTLSGSDTKADYQAALRTVKYVNNNHSAPSSTSRTVSFVASDGDGRQRPGNDHGHDRPAS